MRVDPSQLPGSLGDVVDTIGIDAALVLVDRLGGTRVYVPEKLSPEHFLVRLLEHKVAYKLAETFPGETIDLPRCVAAIRAIRDESIRAARNGGASIRSLALRHGLTERQIYSILAEGEPEASPQQSLI